MVKDGQIMQITATSDRYTQDNKQKDNLAKTVYKQIQKK